MSELLDEAREETSEARLSASNQQMEEPEYMYNQGFHMACKHMLQLIEKYEKPKGLMQYVRPPYWGLPLEFNLNFWRLKYDVRDIIQDDKSVEEMRWDIGQKFDRFHFAELDIELTREQQEIYEYFKQGYKEFPGYPNNDESIANTMESFSIAFGGKDEDMIPALKKFLSEVE